MDEINITVKNDPVPAQRPRFSGRRCYQPARNAEYRSEVEYAARLAMRDKEPMTGALSACVKLYRKYKPTSRIFGDVDNHLKALFDGMNQIVFEDDAQIVQCSVSKHTDKKNPRAEIFLSEV